MLKKKPLTIQKRKHTPQPILDQMERNEHSFKHVKDVWHLIVMLVREKYSIRL